MLASGSYCNHVTEAVNVGKNLVLQALSSSCQIVESTKCNNVILFVICQGRVVTLMYGKRIIHIVCNLFFYQYVYLHTTDTELFLQNIPVRSG